MESDTQIVSSFTARPETDTVSPSSATHFHVRIATQLTLQSCWQHRAKMDQ